MTPRVRLVVIACSSWALAMLILNRWAFTDLGEKSFGRLWMFYTSWSDFGFARRMAVGTLLTETRLNRLIDNEYVFSYLLYALLLTVVYVLLFLSFARTTTLIEQGWLQAAVFLSPAFVLHLAYATGTLDLVLVLIFLVALLFSSRVWSTALLIVMGVLSHELFVFMLPALITLKVLQAHWSSRGNTLITAGWLTAAGLASALMVTVAGRLQTPRLAYEQVMAERMPTAAYEHGLWSGYFEVSSTVSDNAGGLVSVGGLLSNWVWIAGPSLYALALAVLVGVFLQGRLRLRIGLAVTCLLPIGTILVAGDYYRWVSTSATVSLLAMVFLSRLDRFRLPTWSAIPLVAAALLAPIGAAELIRPFPMHQLILERLTG